MSSPNIFQVAGASYDSNSDTLILEIYLARSCIDPNFEIDMAESMETFRITANFSSRRHEIEDTGDMSGDVEISYAPLVLASAMIDFERRYSALSHDATPVDPYCGKPVRFNVVNLHGDVV